MLLWDLFNLVSTFRLFCSQAARPSLHIVAATRGLAARLVATLFDLFRSMDLFNILLGSMRQSAVVML